MHGRCGKVDAVVLPSGHDHLFHYYLEGSSFSFSLYMLPFVSWTLRQWRTLERELPQSPVLIIWLLSAAAVTTGPLRDSGQVTY